MQTVILRPMLINVDGVVEYYIKGDKLIVKYTLNAKEPKEVLHLVALSSKKPANAPLKIEVPVFEGSTCSGKKEISKQDAAFVGYNLYDIDTFALLFEEDEKIKIGGAGFGSLFWDISYQKDRKLKTDYDNPVESAQKLLFKIKGNSIGKEEYKGILKRIKETICSFDESLQIPHTNYKWYVYDCWENPVGLSSIRHLIHTEEFIGAYLKDPLCLIGIGEDMRLAVAIKTEDKNPFVNAEDCAIRKNNFWITGILLKEDGQYFERIE